MNPILNQNLEVVAKLASEVEFDDFFVGSVSRKLTYPIGHRQFAGNPNPAKKARIRPRMEFCNHLFSKGIPYKES